MVTSQPQPPEIAGMTLQIHVSDISGAREFYASLFGRGPDFQPHDDFLEWAPIPGQECWVQVVGKGAPPLSNRVRFKVGDLRAATSFLQAIGVEYSEPIRLPGVVAFLDFTDPWENRLGFYQDLLPSGEQHTYPGSSVTDEGQYRTFGGAGNE